MSRMHRVASVPVAGWWAAAISLAHVAGCATGGPVSVSPGEIPALEARIERNPSDADALHRYAAALFAADRCDEATQVAERARAADPADPVGVLVAGQCLEREERYEDALALYGAFLSDHGAAEGADAVRAREDLARRARATGLARAAVQQEQAVAPGAEVVSDAVGVLPLLIEGDPSYQPLSRGLAHILTTDLAIVGRFPLVERVQLVALLDELRLSETEMVDPETAARMGRMIRAGRLLQGLVVIPPDAETHMESNVVEQTGEVTAPQVVNGPFQELMRLEKDLVLGVVEDLGYVLTAAERQRILENGTRSLLAFLAFSRGIMAEDRGDYAAAAEFYAEALREDPGFDEARRRLRIVVAIAATLQSTPGDITALGPRIDRAIAERLGEEDAGPSAEGRPVEISALISSITDVASMQAERASRGADDDGSQEIEQLTGTNVLRPSLPIQTIIQIVLRIP